MLRKRNGREILAPHPSQCLQLRTCTHRVGQALFLLHLGRRAAEATQQVECFVSRRGDDIRGGQITFLVQGECITRACAGRRCQRRRAGNELLTGNDQIHSQLQLQVGQVGRSDGVLKCRQHCNTGRRSIGLCTLLSSQDDVQRSAATLVSDSELFGRACATRQHAHGSDHEHRPDPGHRRGVRALFGDQVGRWRLDRGAGRQQQKRRGQCDGADVPPRRTRRMPYQRDVDGHCWPSAATARSSTGSLPSRRSVRVGAATMSGSTPTPTKSVPSG
ncbi:hypothetical protein NB706_000323 [Xanthomonas sacchari]|nr:hypothetical protein [Xanthomonas sacchari]